MTQDEFKEFIEVLDKVYGTETLWDGNEHCTQFLKGNGEHPMTMDVWLNPSGKLLIMFSGCAFCSQPELIRTIVLCDQLDDWDSIDKYSLYIVRSSFPYGADEEDIQRLEKICEKYNEEQKGKEE